MSSELMKGWLEDALDEIVEVLDGLRDINTRVSLLRHENVHVLTVPVSG